MQTISKTQALNRWDVLPMPLKEALANPTTGESVFAIAHAAHLDDRRAVHLARITSYLLMGFLDKEDAARELAESAGLPAPTARTVVDELYRKILSPLKNDIDSIYTPIPDEVEEEPVAEKPELSTPVFLRPRATPPPPTATPTTPPTPTNAPFVLHEEKPLTADAKKETMKGFSLPFGLFKPKPPEAAATPKVTVEAPKTVHYSEYRTNLSSGAGGEFINLETFGKMRPAADSTKEPVSPPEIQGVDVRPSSTGGANAGAAPAKPNTPTVMPVAAPGFPMKESSLVIKKDAPQPLPRRSPESESATPKVEGNTLDLR